MKTTLVCILCLMTVAVAANTVTGKVRDIGEKYDGLPGATVTVKAGGVTKTTGTDGGGDYAADGLPENAAADVACTFENYTTAHVATRTDKSTTAAPHCDIADKTRTDAAYYQSIANAWFEALETDDALADRIEAQVNQLPPDPKSIVLQELERLQAQSRKKKPKD